MPLKFLTILTLLVLGNATSVSLAANEEATQSLEAARVVGREKSRILKDVPDASPIAASLPEANLVEFRKSIEPVLTKSCVGCHGPKRSEGRLRIDQLNPDAMTGPDVERWREVFNAIGKSEMPPRDEPDYALADIDRGGIVDWLSEELKKASLVRRNRETQTSFRRLTRYEYTYALQDLLGLSFPPPNKLPPESKSKDGFQNSSELLQMSVMQFETSRELGLSALRRAIVIGPRPPVVTYMISMPEQWEQASSAKNAQAFDRDDKEAKRRRNQPYLLHQDSGKGFLFPDGKTPPRTDAEVEHTPTPSPVVLVMPRASELKLDLDRFLPDDGIMRVRIRAGRSTMNPDEYASLRLIFSAHTSNNANFSQVVSARDMPVTASADAPEFIDFEISLSDIQRNPFRKLATTFPRRDEFLHIRNISNAAGGEDRLNVLIDSIEITAPYYEQWPPKSHTDIFFESPHRDQEAVYAREVLNRFLKRAWRRPVTTQEVDQFLGLLALYRPDFTTFEEAIQEVLATALAGPEFLYLTQRQPSAESTGSTTISELELASRLAIFLWSSLPDDELLTLAEQGKLREPAVLSAQVKRLLADPRSRRFSQTIVEQWLGLDRLESVTHLTDEALRDAIKTEPIAFFEDVLQQNRSVLDFLHSDDVMVNERLANHYRIPKVFGPHFRKVAINPESHRGGLLTCAAILAMNSDGKDSHPLKRGVWMLERILNDPPPPPPPNVPEVDLTNPEILKMTLKERLADHRSKAACYSCHARIDPWGIAFENYDALGAYRTHIKDQPVDATSVLFNQETLAGMNGLKHYLLTNRQDQFAQAMVHKLFAYALGRPLTLGDQVEIDRVTAEFRRQDDRLGDLIQLIVSSPLFNSR